MIINVLNELESGGTLRLLVRSGVIPAKVIFYREIYLKVTAYMLINKCSMALAISEVSEELRVTERTVHRAIKAMKAA